MPPGILLGPRSGSSSKHKYHGRGGWSCCSNVRGLADREVVAREFLDRVARRADELDVLDLASLGHVQELTVEPVDVHAARETRPVICRLQEAENRARERRPVQAADQQGLRTSTRRARPAQ